MRKNAAYMREYHKKYIRNPEIREKLKEYKRVWSWSKRHGIKYSIKKPKDATVFKSLEKCSLCKIIIESTPNHDCSVSK